MNRNHFKFVTLMALAVFIGLVFYSKSQSESTSVSVKENRLSTPVGLSPYTNNHLCAQSKLIGEWISLESGSSLFFNRDCEFINQGCQSKGIFKDYPEENSGKLILNSKEVARKKLANCPVERSVECNYIFSNKSDEAELVINCENKSLKYKNKKNETLNNVNKEKSKFDEPNKQKNDFEVVSTSELDTQVEHQEKKSNSKKLINGEECDGIYRPGARRCYFSNIPTIFTSGGTFGQTLWSSSTLDPKIYLPQFVSENSFNVRVITKNSSEGVSTFGKKCNLKSFQSTKLKIKIMLRKEENRIGEMATLISEKDKPSDVWHFQIPQSNDQSYVLEVVDVESNSACLDNVLKNTSLCKRTGFSILKKTYNEEIAKECASFDIQFSTDSTYDLPGKRAN